MTPAAFVAKWPVNIRNERAAPRSILDLCALLNEPTPNSGPTGTAYTFDKVASNANGGEGRADEPDMMAEELSICRACRAPVLEAGA